MISGCLTEKKGYWYILLSLKNEMGERRQKWISTGIKSPGNKKLVEEMLYEKRMEYTTIADMKDRSKGVYFDEYLLKWLNSRKEEISATTYTSYAYFV